MSEGIIYFIFVALIGGVVGYLIGKSSCAKRSSCNEGEKGTHELHIDQREQLNKESTPVSNEPKEVGKKPKTLLPEPKEGGKENLQLIKGIGKVSEKTLNDLGIYYFKQIANLTKEEVIWLNSAIGAFPGKIEREEWVAQAIELAKNSK